MFRTIRYAIMQGVMFSPRTVRPVGKSSSKQAVISVLRRRQILIISGDTATVQCCDHNRQMRVGMQILKHIHPAYEVTGEIITIKQLCRGQHIMISSQFV